MAHTYYVRAAGNDQLDGRSVDRAWATLDRVNQAALGPGDTVRFEGGATFTGYLYFAPPRVGAPGRPIVLESYGSGRARLAAGEGIGIMVENGGNFLLRNLHVVGDGLARNDNYGLLFRHSDGTARRYASITLDSLEVEGFRWGGIRFDVVSPGTNQSQGGFQQLRLTHLSAHHNGDVGIQVVGEQRAQGYSNAKIYIAYCEAYQNPGVSTKDWNHTGNGIVVGNSEEVLIEHCLAYENGRDNTYPGGGPVGIWLWDTRQGIIQHCESHHNQSGSLDGGGFDLDGGCVDCVMQYNYSHDNEGAGFLLASYPGSRPLLNSTIRYNISENDGRDQSYGAFHLWKPTDTEIAGVYIYNNTGYQNRPPRGRSALVKVAAAGIEAVRLHNNAFISVEGGELVDLHQGSDSAVTMRYNAYYASGVPLRFRQGNRRYEGLSAWQIGTGKELSNGRSTAYAGPPGLSQLGQGGTLGQLGRVHTLQAYRPYPDSPLLGQGGDLAQLGLEAMAFDFFGHEMVGQSHRDIGAGVIGRGDVTKVQLDHWTLGQTPHAYALGEQTWQIQGLPVGKRFEYQLVNMQGRVLQQGPLSANGTLYFESPLPAGYYWLRLSHQQDVVTLRLLHP